MDDGPPRVVDHLGPVLLLELLAVVAEQHLADRVRAADAVVVQHGHLQVHLPQHACNTQTDGILRASPTIFMRAGRTTELNTKKGRRRRA